MNTKLTKIIILFLSLIYCNFINCNNSNKLIDNNNIIKLKIYSVNINILYRVTLNEFGISHSSLSQITEITDKFKIQTYSNYYNRFNWKIYSNNTKPEIRILIEAYDSTGNHITNQFISKYA